MSTSTEYFNEVGKEIDYEETGNADMVSCEQADHIQRILTCEASMFLLRRATGICGSLVDDMTKIRRDFITSYEEKYGEYKYPNAGCDF